MATRFVGPGGNDGNSGLTWALRKLTLNGVEDTPVVAGDLVWVGPGVYRETLTCDVNGGPGTEIVYVADVTGENTDGVGGIVRITGSDNDTTYARNSCITANDIIYRTFRGFRMDMADVWGIFISDCENWIIEDCSIIECDSTAIIIGGPDQADITIRRCVFWGTGQSNFQIHFTHGATVDDTNHLVENCIMIGNAGFALGVASTRVGGITIRNSLFMAVYRAIVVAVALAIGQTVTVENCIIMTCKNGLEATGVGEIVEDFNLLSENTVDRTNTNTGANSVSHMPLLLSPLLFSGVAQISGFKFPWWFGELSEWSQIQAITGANEPTEDLQGIARPVTASKNSWGAIQFRDMARETGTVRTGSVSMAIRDAGRHQIWVPVTATSTTIRIYVYREANYAGNLPQMIIKQPGQADDVTTDVGAAGGWNLLTTTLVPAADPPYVVVELVSRNTNGAADEVFFDDLDVS